MPSSTSKKFEDLHVRPKPGRTLLVGSRVYEGKEDRRLWHSSPLGVDMLPGPGVDRVLNLEERPPEDLGKFDHIECLSVLEHSKAPWKLAANLERLMVPGATIYLSVPFIWRVHGYPSDYWRFTRDGVRELFRKIGWIALCTAHSELKHNDLLISRDDPETGIPSFLRTEILGFGIRNP